MEHEPQPPGADRREEAVRRAHRTARQMRWAVRGVLALVVLLGVLWMLMMGR